MNIEIENQIIECLKELCLNFREETYLKNDIARGTLLEQFEVFLKYDSNQKNFKLFHQKLQLKNFN